MRAFQVTEFCDPAEVSILDVPEPKLGDREVKIKTEGVGVGYFDALFVKGEYQIRPPLPFIPGSSIAGVVDAVGEKVEGIKPGDRVAASTLTGGLAEKCVLPVSNVIQLPDRITCHEAANFFMTYATGVLGLKNKASLKAGETVMVLGASGTTGTSAMEIALAMGATVIACASTPEKRQACLDLGAAQAIDYSQPDWNKQIKKLFPDGVDVVYDPVGGRWAEPALRCMAPGGRYLVVGFVDGIASIPLNLLLLKRCAMIGVNWGGETLPDPSVAPPVIKQIIEWAMQGKLQTEPDKVYPLAMAGEALSSLLGRTSIGKIVIDPSV